MRLSNCALKQRGERFRLDMQGADMAVQSWVVQIYSVSNRAVQHMIVGRLRKIDGLTVEPTVSGRDVLVVMESPDRPHAGWVSRTVHWIDPVPWKIAGNIFSNFYEEFIFRGFMLTALAAAIGFWPAAIVSSAMWGFTHNQYPLSLQALIAAIGIYWSYLTRRARSLWTPYSAHMVLDIVGDSLIG